MVLFFLISVALPRQVYSALYINEFSSGTTDDWVEIYNSDLIEVDLSQYFIRDSTESDSNKIDLTGTITGNGFIAVEFANKLNNSGDRVRLLKIADNSIVDEISYGDSGTIGILTGEQTAGRNPDGSTTWAILSASTKGLSNNSSSIVPTVTPTPTATPIPTNAPTPTKTPTPTKIPTPTRSTSSGQATLPSTTPKPSLTKSPTGAPSISPSDEVSSDSGEVMGIVLAKSDDSKGLKKEDERSLEEKKKGFPFGKVFLITGGVLFVSGCGILLYKKYREEKEVEI